MHNDDFKYVIQDTGNVYFGRELTYNEMMERDDVPFKFKAIINMYISKDASLDKKISEHVMEIDASSFAYKVFEQLKLAVRVCYKTQSKGFMGIGREKEKWMHEACNIKQFCEERRGNMDERGMIIEDISISKLALMMLKD